MKTAALLLGLLFSDGALAWQSPRQAIDEFLNFELSGGRTASWEFDKYLAVQADYDEPGWDEAELIQSAKVLSVVCVEQHCKAKVEFKFAPTERLGLSQVVQHPKGGSQVVIYDIVRKKGEWLLTSTKGTPRVSHAAFKRLYPNGF